MNKKWELYDVDSSIVEDISANFDLPELISRVLVDRGIVNKRDIEVYLNPTRNDFHDPFLMPDMEIAVDRILEAIANKERVIIYGDYDVDGITSTTVLKKFLVERGLDVDTYIPKRLDEGYGLNSSAIDYIKEQGYTLMITVDCRYFWCR